MRLFCTCDCQKTLEGLENALRQLRGLKADHEDLYDRFIRLQGRLAARVKQQDAALSGNGSETVSDASAVDQRRAAINAAILARRGHAVPRREG